MRKTRVALLLLALLALLGAHLHPQYRVSVEGMELPGRYSAAALREGRRAAEEAAGEILRYEAKMPAVERRLCLSLRPAGDDVPALTAALLRPVSGIGEADAVYVNGVRLGTVADGERFCEGPVYPASRLVNTVGAGDSFIAGFLVGVLMGDDVAGCLDRGARIASEVVGVFEPWVVTA